jgi:hypothetical protein
MNDTCGPIRLLPLQHPCAAVAGAIGTWLSTPSLHHSITPSLRAAGFEDEDENEAPPFGTHPLSGPADTVSLAAGDRALALDYKRLNETARQIGGSRIDHRHQVLEAHLAQGREVLFNRR